MGIARFWLTAIIFGKSKERQVKSSKAKLWILIWGALIIGGAVFLWDLAEVAGEEIVVYKSPT